MDRRSFLRSASALMLASTFPSHLLAGDQVNAGRLIFGTPPGSIGGALANGVLKILATDFNTDFRLDIIDTRNSIQAMETTKRAPADGSTVLLTSSSALVLFPSTYQKLAYDPIKDFTPLAVMGEYAYSLAVGPAVPEEVQSVDEYINWVLANPDFRDIGFSLYGSHGHLVALMMARNKGVALRPQPYKASSSLVNDIKEGILAAGIVVTGNTATLGGNFVRPLAVSGKQRQAGWPAIRTFAEQGVENMDVTGWYGWMAPADMPAANVQEWRSRISAMQATPQYDALLKSLLLSQVTLSPQQIQQRMRTEIASYGDLVRSYGLQRQT